MTESGTILRELVAAIEAGKSVAVATIIRRAGSSPRDVGAKMLIYPDGAIYGTIGGGKFENRVIQDSLELLRSTDRGSVIQYRFSSEGERAIGMTCGGQADVFIELFRAPRRLMIFGGGHVGHELARLAVGSNFLITVVDDRPEILAGYEGVISGHQAANGFRGDLPEALPDDFVVIVTRSHESDLEVLRHYVASNYGYLGMMGSKAKIAKLFEGLRQEGISEAQLDSVHAPIGLNIGAEGPYEIAVSILAELTAVRNQMGQKPG